MSAEPAPQLVDDAAEQPEVVQISAAPKKFQFSVPDFKAYSVDDAPKAPLGDATNQATEATDTNADFEARWTAGHNAVRPEERVNMVGDSRWTCANRESGVPVYEPKPEPVYDAPRNLFAGLLSRTEPAEEKVQVECDAPAPKPEPVLPTGPLSNLLHRDSGESVAAVPQDARVSTIFETVQAELEESNLAQQLQVVNVETVPDVAVDAIEAEVVTEVTTEVVEDEDDTAEQLEGQIAQLMAKKKQFEDERVKTAELHKEGQETIKTQLHAQLDGAVINEQEKTQLVREHMANMASMTQVDDNKWVSEATKETQKRTVSCSRWH